MFIEIGALVQKSVGNEALHKIINCKGVEYAFMETGRSNDLFEERQFGDFGEAAIISVIAEVSAKDEVMKSLHAYCNLERSAEGLIFAEQTLIRTSLDK